MQQTELKFFEDHPLIKATLRPSTLKSYSRAVQCFLESSNIDQLSSYYADDLLTAYIHDRYFEDPAAGQRQEMSNLLAAVVLILPHLKGKIGRARRSIRGWQITTPPRSALPLTRDWMLAFAYYMIASKQTVAAVALAVSWAGYLRASEVLSSQWENVALPGDIRLSQFRPNIGGISVLIAKTGPCQFVSIRDPAVLTLLQFYWKHTEGKGSTFPISYYRYRKALSAASLYFGLDPSHFTPHSARFGGAFHDLCNGKSAETIAIHSRWASLNSLRYYLTNGRAWLLRLPIASSQQELMSKARDEVIRFVARLKDEQRTYRTARLC